MPTGSCPFTQRIGCYWAWSGGVNYWWIGRYRSAWGRCPSCLRRWQTHCYGSWGNTEWCTRGNQYLDDFLILGPPQSDLCRQHLQTSLGLCKRLGIPIATHKLEGPAPVLSFVGIKIDSVSGTLSQPAEKLARLKGLITAWRTRKCCKKRELLSLIGQLQHACRIVRTGHTFLRRMIDLSTVPRELDHWVRLNWGFQSGLHWWDVFLEQWNGVGMCSGVVQKPPSDTITSDASGRWVCGAFTTGGEWFQFCWPLVWEQVHITIKELLPVVAAWAVWVHQWPGGSIRVLWDKAAVVAIIKAGT